MSKWNFNFPPSRSCLWDSTPTGSSTELHITRNSWLCVQLTPSALQLAVRHAKQSSRKLFDCFLIATAWTTEGEGLAVEIDRFDPGRPSPNGSGLIPTTLIPGDIAIPSQVTVKSHPEAKYLTHNLTTLQQSIDLLMHTLSSHPSPLDPALLLSLRIHCTCSEDGKLGVQCGCVYPATVIEATPIIPIAIVQTALARNLGGPLSLSAIQGKIKHGYVTMEASRKLVLLLHSDPKATDLPLVGIWVSGVSSLRHPVVWTACVAYINSTALSDRVWGEGGSFVTLVYLEGSSQPVFSQCTCDVEDVDHDSTSFKMACGESALQPSSNSSPLCFELHPVQESASLHTLLETVTSSFKNRPISPPSHTRAQIDLGKLRSPKEVTCDLVPLPSPHPTPTQIPNRPMRDSELSMLSCVSLSDGTQRPPTSTEYARTNVTSTSISSPSYNSPSVFNTKQLLEDKENTPVEQPLMNLSKMNLDNSVCSRNSGDSEELEENLVVFPNKQQGSLSQLHMTPRSDTRNLLRQQERQLRVLQEQVNSLLQAQSQSPAVQSLNATPTVEASTSTGESLYCPHPPSPFHHTQSTPSQVHTHPEADRDESSVCCSSIVSGLSVPTAASMLSQNISDIHLDLQSYAQSPSPPLSPSFGDSASVLAAARRDDSDGSPVSLLFKDQQQFYQNMLCQVNALLHSQNDISNPQDSSQSDVTSHSELPIIQTPSQHCSSPSVLSERRGILEAAPSSPSISNHSRSQLSCHSSHHSNTELQHCQDHSLPASGIESRNTSSLSNSNSLLGHTLQTKSYSNVTHSTTNQNRSAGPFYIHSDVLQQRYGNEVSMLPVPRIVCPVLTDNSNSYSDTSLFPKRAQNIMIGGSSDCTLDENMQLADMIAMKYIGNALPSDQADRLLGRPKTQLYVEGTDSILDTGSAHMSIATKQYLQRHHLLNSDGSRAPSNTINEGVSPTGDGEGSTQTAVGSDNILNIRRLKMLPKLI